ncbi:leucine-rich repeat-containing protein 74B-like isoform X2 [Microplitis mediator]|uniref:leucine-rich repeat-containing protein 74B-like isoform X2 n=1 Tax=Microplitis mediator TaxID=375433 RepID=UPI00255356BF|nr:leucine-rich repeat-containing protein 74B-like isoform X2 [Microplitis mediator]
MDVDKRHEDDDHDDEDDQDEYEDDEAEISNSSYSRLNYFINDLLEENLFENILLTDVEKNTTDEIKSESNGSSKTIISSQDSTSTIESSDTGMSKCSEQIEISDSQIDIPEEEIPEDGGLRPGSWILFPKLPEDRSDDVEKFINLTEELKLPPIGQVPQMLKTNEINLKFYCLDPRTVKIISEALNCNTTVKILNLQDNWLTTEACYHLNDLLINNNVITWINLSGCRIGVQGAKELETGISSAESLEYLDVSRCDLGDDGLRYISIGVYCSPSIKIVNFSNNNLSEDCANALQKMIIQTDTLSELNLSWNFLSSEGFWKIFVVGLLQNVTLKNLNLSWNGLDEECLPFLTEYLSSDPSLFKLNLRDNSFKSVEKIAEALIKNTKLEIIELGNNPTRANEVLAFFEVLKNITPTSQLRLIDLENIWANKEVLGLIDEIKKKLTSVDITLGGILSNYKIIGPDPRKIFLKRANFEAMKPKKKKLKRNFGQFVVSLQDIIVTRDVFKSSIKNAKVKLSESLITEIMNSFEIGEDAIDQSALKNFYLAEYPETSQLPPLPVTKNKKKEKKTPGKKQNIGH